MTPSTKFNLNDIETSMRFLEVLQLMGISSANPSSLWLQYMVKLGESIAAS